MAPGDAHLANAVAPLLGEAGEHETPAMPPGALHAFMKTSQRPRETVQVT